MIDIEVKDRDENYISMIIAQGGMHRLNMHTNDIYDILQLDIFQKWIPDTWDNENGNTLMRPAKCGQCCGVEFNGLDFGELGNKKDSYIVKENNE